MTPHDELPREELMILLDRERDGALDDRGRARLAEIVASDPALADEARELRALGDLFAAVAPVRAPDDLAAGVLGAVHATPPRGRLLRFAPLLSATVAAALVIGLFLVNGPDAARDASPAGDTDVASGVPPDSRALDAMTPPTAARRVSERTRVQEPVRAPSPDPSDEAGAAREDEDDGEDGEKAVAQAPSEPVPAPSPAPITAPERAVAPETADAPASDRGDGAVARDDAGGGAAKEGAGADDAEGGTFGGVVAPVPVDPVTLETESDAGRALRAGEPVLWVTELGGTRYAVFTDETAARAYAARLVPRPAAPAAPPPARSPATRGGGSRGGGSGGGGAGAAPPATGGRIDVGGRMAAAPDVPLPGVTVVADLRLAREALDRRRRAPAREKLDVARGEDAETVTAAEAKDDGVARLGSSVGREGASRVQAAVEDYLSGALADKLPAELDAGDTGAGEAAGGPDRSSDEKTQRSTDRIVILLVR